MYSVYTYGWRRCQASGHSAPPGVGATYGLRLHLRESMAARGKTPDFALVLEVEEAFFHCSKCVVRSNLWTPQAWPALDGLPSLAQTMVDAAALPMPVEALQEIITQDEAERPY